METKQADTVTMSGPLMPGHRSPMMNSRNREMTGFVVRVTCLASSLVWLCLVVLGGNICGCGGALSAAANAERKDDAEEGACDPFS